MGTKTPMDGKPVTSDNVGEVQTHLDRIIAARIPSEDTRRKIRKDGLLAEARTEPTKHHPQMPSEAMARADFRGRVATQIRSVRDPKTGELDETKLAKLPENVQTGLRTAMATAETIGTSIQNAGYSRTGAMKHRDQTFLNVAMESPDVMRHMTETTLARGDLPPTTRRAAEVQLAALPTTQTIGLATQAQTTTIAMANEPATP